jgi:hypothetical protein
VKLPASGAADSERKFQTASPPRPVMAGRPRILGIDANAMVEVAARPQLAEKCSGRTRLALCRY